MTARRPAIARRAATACSWGTKYSLCSSAPLLGAVLRRHGADRVARDRGGRGGEEGRRDRALTTVCDQALDPDLVDGLAAPVGEQADAVGARHNIIEVSGQLGQRQIVVDLL